MARAAPAPTHLTDAEYLLLGLVAEMPRHGYELEQEIERRSMREWTRIGFSSIYFVLGKLHRAGLVSAKQGPGGKARKVFRLAPAGQRALVAHTLAALGTHRPTYSSLLLGMLHWPVLAKAEALQALEARAESVRAEVARLEEIRAEQQPLPDFVDALFDFSIGQLQGEAEWVGRTLAYMREKPWLDDPASPVHLRSRVEPPPPSRSPRSRVEGQESRLRGLSQRLARPSTLDRGDRVGG